jgi:hypothetical protein
VPCHYHPAQATTIRRKQLEEQLDRTEGSLREVVSGIDKKPLISVLDRRERILGPSLLHANTTVLTNMILTSFRCGTE